MKFVIILILLIVQTSYSFIQVFTSKDWNKFKLKHDKTYSSLLEEKIRVEIFLQNLKIITKHNIDFALGRVSYEMGINHFSDMHPDEVLIEYTGDIDDQSSEDYENFKEYTPLQKEVNIPNTVDWRSSGAVTPVKNQGRCGSCWTFATTGVIEGQLYLKSNDQTPLSEQNLLDCAEKNYSNKGCRGGLTLRALQYIQDYGIQSENSYPYTSVQGDCQFNQQKSVITTKGYVKLPVNDEDSLKEAVASIGPIAVSILVTKKFPKYKQGVFYDSTCNDKTNHAVLVVGYGTDDLTNEDYWLVKNSWGVKWGSNGYIKMARNRNNNCNIAMRGVFPKL